MTKKVFTLRLTASHSESLKWAALQHGLAEAALLRMLLLREVRELKASHARADAEPQPARP